VRKLVQRCWPRHAPSIIFLATLLLYGYRLSAPDLMERDEGRYAAVAREMLESRDFVTPRFNGFVYLAKPPMLHWLTALSFALLGRSEFATRFPCTLAAAAGAMLVYVMGRRMFGHREGLTAAAVLVSSMLWFGVGRMIRYDMLLTIAVSAVLWWTWCGIEEERRHAFIAAAAAAGFGVLVKGPIALALPGLIVLIYLTATRRLRVLAAVPWIPCLVVLALIVLPWSVLCERTNPGAVRFFLMHENLARAAGSMDVMHQQPWWFALASLLGGLFPWTFALLGALAQGVAGGKRREAGPGRACLFLWTWLAVTVAVFATSAIKLPPYILPAMPAAALLIGRHLGGAERGGRWSLAFTALFVLAFGISGLAVGEPLLAGAGVAAGPFLGAIAVLAALTFGAVLPLTDRGKCGTGIALVSAFALVTWHLAVPVAERAGPLLSEKPLALAVSRHLTPSQQVVCYGRLSRNLVFYLDRRVISVGREVPDEYDFPGNAPHLKGMAYPPEAAEFLFATSPPMIGTSPEKHWRFLQGALPRRVVYLERVGAMIVFRTVPTARLVAPTAGSCTSSAPGSIPGSARRSPRGSRPSAGP